MQMAYCDMKEKVADEAVGPGSSSASRRAAPSEIGRKFPRSPGPATGAARRVGYASRCRTPRTPPSAAPVKHEFRASEGPLTRNQLVGLTPPTPQVPAGKLSSNGRPPLSASTALVCPVNETPITNGSDVLV